MMKMNLERRRKMLNLDDYGYLLEEYDYSFDEDDHVKEIAYSRYNEKGKEVKAVGVCRNPNGECVRSIVRWPQNNEDISEPDGVVNDRVPNMSLDLITTGKQRSKSDDIVVYRYENCDDKNEEIYFPIKSSDNVKGAILKEMAFIYDKNLHIGEAHRIIDGNINFNEVNSTLQDTDFGIIQTSDIFVAVAYNSYSYRQYTMDQIDTDIESLKYKCTKVEFGSYTDDSSDDDTYIKYHDNGMVFSVKSANDDMYSRTETVIVGDTCTTITVYPALITENTDNYRHAFLNLWAIDTLVKEDGSRVSFERKLYVIRDYRDLVGELRKDLDTLKLL